MSFRLGLSPRFLAHSVPRFAAQPRPFSTSSQSLILSRIRPRQQPFKLYGYTFGIGLSFLALQSLSPTRKLQCQTASPFAGRPEPAVWDGPPPESQISAFQLGFGSAAGICTGVFIKKGLKAIAFLLGGAFVLLQVSIREGGGRGDAMLILCLAVSLIKELYPSRLGQTYGQL